MVSVLVRFLETLLAIASLVCMVIGIAEVPGSAIGMAIMNLILALLLFLVPIVMLVGEVLALDAMLLLVNCRENLSFTPKKGGAALFKTQGTLT